MSFVNQYRSTTIYGELKVQKYNTGNIAGLLDISGNTILRGDCIINGNLSATDGTIDISGNLAVSGNISGTFSGSIANATNATNATNVAIATDASNQSFYPTFVRDISSNLPLKVDSDLTYNPSTNTLVVSNITGTASSVNVTVDGTNTSYRIPFLSATSGSANIYSDGGITYNPSTNVLTATSFNGTATLASQVDVNTASAASVHYIPIFTGAAAGTKLLVVDTGLNYNRATDTLSVTNINGSAAQVSVSTTNTGTRYLGMFAGSGDRTCLIDTGLTYDASNNILTVDNITGTCSNATNATNATNIGVINNDDTNATFYITFVSATSGNLPPNVDASFNFNPTANSLYVPKINNANFITGNGNNALGSLSLGSVTTGGANTALGNQALSSITTGESNVAIGDGAIRNGTAPNQNIAIGRNALELVTASNNIAVGNEALSDTSSGIQNVGVGHASLDTNTTGSYNTAIGYSSGSVNRTGTYNTFLGFDADVDASFNTWNNSTAIGANSRITASNTIFMGTTSETVNVLGSLTKSRIAFKTQSYASGSGNTSVDLADGNHFFITGTTAFRLTLPNSSLNDGDFLYLRKTSSTAFVVTLSWSTVSLINTSNVSQTSTNATLFAGGVFELKMIYRAANTSWYIVTA